MPPEKAKGAHYYKNSSDQYHTKLICTREMILSDYFVDEDDNSKSTSASTESSRATYNARFCKQKVKTCVD